MADIRKTKKAARAATREIGEHLKDIATELRSHAQVTRPSGATAAAIDAHAKRPDTVGESANRIARAAVAVAAVVGLATCLAVYYSKGAVDAANSQLQQSRDALETAQRAWIVPIDVAQFVFELNGQPIIGAQARLRNSGQSPALNLRPLKALVTLPHGGWPQVVLKDDWGPGDEIIQGYPVPSFDVSEQSTAVLANGADLPVNVSSERPGGGPRFFVKVTPGAAPQLDPGGSTQAVRARVLAGEQDVLIAIRLDYIDIFKKEHRTYACYLWEMEAGARVCPRLNSAN